MRRQRASRLKLCLLPLRDERVRVARARRRLADGLERAVERSAATGPLFSAAVPVSREAAGGARGALLDLAERLRQPRPVDPEGLARVRRLLCDGAGPLYCGEPGELRKAALGVLEALETGDDTVT